MMIIFGVWIDLICICFMSARFINIIVSFPLTILFAQGLPSVEKYNNDHDTMEYYEELGTVTCCVLSGINIAFYLIIVFIAVLFLVILIFY